MLELKLTSPLEKFFPCHRMEDVPGFSPYPVFSGEAFAVNAVFCDTEASLKTVLNADITCDSGEIRVYRLDSVPVRLPCYPDSCDSGYMTKEAGVYPDILTEISRDTLLFAPSRHLAMLRIEVTGATAGEHKLTVTLRPKKGELAEEVKKELTFSVIDEVLPPRRTAVMQWLHADCIALYYNVPALSDEHFELLGRWIRTAVENGINCLYTPVFTPPLDTEVGGERLTVQLAYVRRDGGKWSFSFEKLDRWCDMALELGVEYFEISHLFTQWGARHAPKIIATVDGVEKKVFGWETDASDGEYIGFLRQFLTEFLNHMKSRGLDRRCIFHISDEPNDEQEASYRHAADSVRDILEGYTVADALSDVKYYTSGACKNPIAGTDHAAEFLPYIPEGLWVYYCCSQSVGVSNRFISMPLWRVRIIGLQMWKARCTGFLHWGYNFYYSQYSRYMINPYICTDGDYFAPAGDAFSVYPGKNGDAVPSIRLRTFYEALCDIRVLEAAEAKFGRAAVEEILGEDLTFDNWPQSAEYIHEVRRRIANLYK